MIDPGSPFELPHDVELETRPLRNADPEFEFAIRSLCEADVGILEAHLMEARRPGAKDTMVLIALLSQDSAGPLRKVAGPFVEILKAFPAYQRRTYILSVADLETPPGEAFYTRSY